MFRFIIGLVSGIAIGVAAANMSQGQSGQDIRAELELMRKDLQQGDFDALGSRLEQRFKELQAGLESRSAGVSDLASDMKADAESAVDEAADAVGDAGKKVEAKAKAN